MLDLNIGNIGSSSIKQDLQVKIVTFILYDLIPHIPAAAPVIASLQSLRPFYHMPYNK